MPVEFRCPSCSKLLRTPDESAGKKAKCPQCGTIVDVPASSSGLPGMDRPLAPIPPIGPLGGATKKADESPFGSGSPTNPYASPAPDFSVLSAGTQRGGLTPTKISFDRILQAVWEVYRPQLGPMALFGLVLLLAYVGLQIISNVIAIPIQATNEPVLIYGFQVINTVVGMLVQAWLNVGAVLYMLKVARQQQATLNEFGAAGPFVVRAFLVQVVITLAVLGIAAVCLGPAGIVYLATRETAPAGVALIVGFIPFFALLIYVTYRWLLAIMFVVDCNMGVMESLSNSTHFMVGNKLIVFVILLVVGLVGGIFGLFTCCIGYVFVISYMQLMMVAIYLTATGQPGGTTLLSRAIK
jgi:hypothetical protein